MAWLVVVAVPALLWWHLKGVDPFGHSQRLIYLGITGALLVGYLSHRRFEDFPGLTTLGSLVPSYGVSFSLMILALFFLRLDYSGWQIITSFVLCIIWSSTMHLAILRHRTLTFGVVPGGDAEKLHVVPQVRWMRFDEPKVPAPHINGVIADLRHDLPGEWERMIANCALSGIPVYHVKDAIERLSGRVQIDHLSENTLGSLNPDQAYLKFKAVMDWIVALIALIALAPLLLVVAIIIRLESPGPALFRQQRTGFRGVPFTVYKFRTMRNDQPPPPKRAGEEGDFARIASITRSNDPRITRVGAFLRKTRIDELPQIINILRGEMSWIGPRPEAIPLTRWYEAQIAFYHYRHILRPGIAGWAQVIQGHVADVDDVREKLQYDFYYVKNFSPWLDLLIAFKTIRIVFTGHGAL